MRRNNQNKRKQSNRVVKNNKNAIKKDRRASINLKEDEEAFIYIVEAIKKAGYEPGIDVNLAIKIKELIEKSD